MKPEDIGVAVLIGVVSIGGFVIGIAIFLDEGDVLGLVLGGVFALVGLIVFKHRRDKGEWPPLDD